MTCAAWNKHERLKEQPENIWLLSLMRWSGGAPSARNTGWIQTLSHCHKKTIFTNLKKRFERIELSAKLLDCFLRSNKGNINQSTKQIQDFLTAARASGEKDKCQVRLTVIEREYWMGTEISRLEGYCFRGTVTAGDGSNQKGGQMEARYVNLRNQRKRQQRKEGGTWRGRIQLIRKLDVTLPIQ